MKKYKVIDKMYNQDLTVYIGGNEKEFKKLLDKKYDIDLILEGATGSHITITKEGEYTRRVIWLEEFTLCTSGYGTLVHEVFHFTTSVMEDIGIPHDKKISDEAYAYYIQHIYMQCLSKLLKDYNKKKNKKKKCSTTRTKKK